MDDITSAVIAVREGALDAFGRLVERFQDMAYGAALAKVGDSHLAEDAAQEAFIEAYRHLPNLRDPAAFPGWFRRIVFRQARRIGRPGAVRTVPLPADALVPSPEPGPAADAEAQELHVRLHAALATLPEPQRLATVLYYINGRSTADIAAFLDVPLSTVKKRLHDSRRKLRGKLSRFVSGQLDQQRPSRQADFRGRVQVRVGVKPHVRRDARPTDSEAELKRLWQRYKKTGSNDLRNELLEHYLHLVRYQSKRLADRLPRQIDPDDLFSSGVFGLMDAISGFDLQRGHKFETYCAQRIRGAMLDELRLMDWAPRQARSRAAKIGRARQTLMQQLGRMPTRQELAEKLGLTMRQFARVERDAETIAITSLSRTLMAGDDGGRPTHEIDLIEDPAQLDPFTAVERLSVRESLLRGMSRAERLIVLLYYFEEMTMHEIGKALGLSESRVSQLHKSILDRLHAQLTRHPELAAPLVA